MRNANEPFYLKPNQEINFALGAMLLLAINFGVFLQSPHCGFVLLSVILCSKCL